MRILVTGATGYVGSRLIPALLEAGHDVRAGSHGDEHPDTPWSEEVEWVPLDVGDEKQVRAATRSMDAVFYLVHGMGGKDFRRKDLEAAERVASACDKARVRRIVYLSGIVPDVAREDLSEHLTSRLEVEEALEAAAASVLTLRAAVIMGAGSTSFEVIRQMSEILPVQPVPRWMCSQVQPIAVQDVVRLLVLAVESDLTGHVDVGGPERVAYPELLRLYAAVSGLRRVQITVPLLPEPLVAFLASRITRVPTSTVEALIESLRHDMVAKDGDIEKLAGSDFHLVGLSESIRRSLRDENLVRDGASTGADPLSPSAADPQWAGGWISLDRHGVAVHRPTRLWQRVLLGVREAGTRSR